MIQSATVCRSAFKDVAEPALTPKIFETPDAGEMNEIYSVNCRYR